MSMRVDRGCALLTGVWFALCLAGAANALAVVGDGADAAALPGLVIDEADAPRAADGRLLDEPGLGARARVQLPPAVERRLGELTEERARAADSVGLEAAPVVPARLPGDATAPSRLDAGDRDPDRLHTLPPLPASR